MFSRAAARTPGRKLMLAVLVGFALSIPLFVTWLLVYDRQSQSERARSSITEGWGGPQVLDGPVLAIPYRAQATDTVVENGQSVTRSRDVTRILTLAPETLQVDTSLKPDRMKRSIYEAVVYDASNRGQARFALPPDLARFGVEPGALDLARAELRFGLSDPRGLGANPRVVVDGAPVRLQPGLGSTGGRGFFAFVDASTLGGRPMAIQFNFAFRGNASLALVPRAGDSTWAVRSAWPHPSFTGDFLPASRTVKDAGFDARWKVGNLALGRSLVTTDLAQGSFGGVEPSRPGSGVEVPTAAGAQTAQITLIQPVDLYSQVDRAAKYGFLFIAFTFLALLMFDVIGGVRVSAVEYLLMGAALVLFFVLLLAFAEVIGFTAAYILASAAIAGLNTAYSAAVLGSWRRGLVIGALLIGLYAVLYILLSLEAFSLLIGALLLFAALAGTMYVTRRLDWTGERAADEAAAA